MAQPEFYSGKTLYPFIGALLALSVLFGLVIMPRLGSSDGRVNQPAPDFELPVVANGAAEQARLRLSGLENKVVVLDFWATWCGPCRQQAPILDRLARTFHDDVVVLGINVGEPPQEAMAYARSKGLSYPILIDPGGSAQRDYDATSLPTVVVVDKQGNIALYRKGLVRQDELERTIRERLAEPNVARNASSPDRG